MIVSSWHQPPASAVLSASCFAVGKEMRIKGFCEKKSLAIGQLVYSLDSKRLSHEGLLSAASQFCRKKNTQ